MEEIYFVIHNGEGDTTVNAYTKEELLRYIEEGYWGMDTKVMTELPDNNDTNYWGGEILIIKGKMVVPVEKKIVTEYDID
jgi:hypothetical protein